MPINKDDPALNHQLTYYARQAQKAVGVPITAIVAIDENRQVASSFAVQPTSRSAEEHAKHITTIITTLLEIADSLLNHGRKENERFDVIVQLPDGTKSRIYRAENEYVNVGVGAD